MSALHFAEPQWFHLLWVIPAFIALFIWLEYRGSSALDRFISTALQQRLVQRTTPLRRLLRLIFLGLCGLFLTLALMRPQWGTQFVSTPRAGAQVMICLDVSNSMLAEDVAPNRLERAKAELRDLLSYLDGDHVGLIAFAGRASVLAPLTPDFSFLNLVLHEAGPHSVTRGGTRLEEPIRKALAGFGDQGDAEVSRSILLITDGEDHDSFPLEAAKAAAERGVRIIAIGFGDEAGSEIIVTDPKTGARTVLRDTDGNPVRSRLDGQLLREIALLTQGAYIPAGTGVLDLKSIYERHIATLTRGQLDGGGYTVRNDAFQWAVLFALVCLLAAVASPAVTLPPRHTTPRGPALTLAVVGLVLAGPVSGLIPLEAWAQTTDSNITAPTLEPASNPVQTPDATTDSRVSPAENTPGNAPSTEAEPESQPLPLRETYNQGLADLNAGNLDAAARRFEDTRTRAGTDGEARFRAIYNLGWVEVQRTDTLLESDPKAALQTLHRAANWFREAITLRPEHQASRRNLERVLRRILALADRLAQRERQDNAARLKQLIKQQRTLLTDLGQNTDLAALKKEPNAVQQTRRTLRDFSSRQLELLTEAERLSETAGQELTNLKAKKSNQEHHTENALRQAQLGQMLHHLHQARERMGQARGQLRRLRAERAYRRVSNALSALKRARDQLLDPIARLDMLLTDGMDLMRQTGQKMALDANPEPSAPTWLTAEYLSKIQSVLAARTGELHQGLREGLTQAQKSPATAPENPGNTRATANQQRLLRQLKAAEPLIGTAQKSFQQAVDALASQQINDALESQRQAVTALAAAREHFFDLKRLVELLYQNEQQIAVFLKPADNTVQSATTPDTPPSTANTQANGASDQLTDPATTLTETASTTDKPSTGAKDKTADPVATPAATESDATANLQAGVAQAEYLPVAIELQTQNNKRLQRITALILDRLVAALDAEEQAQKPPKNQKPATTTTPQAPDPASPDPATPDPEALKAERQLMEQADGLRVETEKAMKQALDSLIQANTASAVSTESSAATFTAALAQARQSVTLALDRAETLRRLFFSVIDHLRETLRHQIDLGDRTEKTAVLAATTPSDQTARHIEPLAPEQASLAEKAEHIADALRQQAQQPAPATPDVQATHAQATPEKTAQAQQQRFNEAAQLVTSARDHMNKAAGAITDKPILFKAIRNHQQDAVEALTKALTVLQPPQQQQKDQQQQDQQQTSRQANQNRQKQQKQQPNSNNLNPLLQGVRDREAQRRRQRTRQQQHPYEPVEKDW